MTGNPQPTFNALALDSGLLATPFRIQTNWHVITGAPSCGKTTLINLLAKAGFRIAPEGARLYLEQELTKGQTIEQVRSDIIHLQCCIKDKQLEIEHALPANEFIFLDRAIPDCLAWYRVFGMNPNEFLQNCFHYRYASIFMLDRLPLAQNGLRFKDETLQSFTHEWHTRDYLALGYPIIRVPVMPPEERLSFALQVLTERGLIVR